MTTSRQARLLLKERLKVRHIDDRSQKVAFAEPPRITAWVALQPGGVGGMNVNPFTVSMWIKINNDRPVISGFDEWMVLSHGLTNGTAIHSPGYKTNLRRQNFTPESRLAVGNDHTGGPIAGEPTDAARSHTIEPGFTFFDGEWHNVVITQSSSPNLQSIFINGKYAMNQFNNISSTLSYPNAPAETMAWVLGGGFLWNGQSGAASSFYSSGFFDGWFDEVRIYNDALSAEQVRSLYENPNAGFPTMASSSASVSEPASLMLLGLGLVGLALSRRSRQ